LGLLLLFRAAGEFQRDGRIVGARRTDSADGVVTASSDALVCTLLQLSYKALSACSVVLTSLKHISCACSDRPEVWTCYHSFIRRENPVDVELRLAD
jgi:hypothetical protein